jgi:four helix bundle protein
MQGTHGNLYDRTKQFALRVITVYRACGRLSVGDVIGRQLSRAGTSIGAQYREACRARSRAEFISKIESASQELEETIYWIELLIESGTIPANRLDGLLVEASELKAMFAASARTAKSKNETSKQERHIG